VIKGPFSSQVFILINAGTDQMMLNYLTKPIHFGAKWNFYYTVSPPKMNRTKNQTNISIKKKIFFCQNFTMLFNLLPDVIKAQTCSETNKGKPQQCFDWNIGYLWHKFSSLAIEYI